MMKTLEISKYKKVMACGLKGSPREQLGWFRTQINVGHAKYRVRGKLGPRFLDKELQKHPTLLLIKLKSNYSLLFFPFPFSFLSSFLPLMVGRKEGLYPEGRRGSSPHHSHWSHLMVFMFSKLGGETERSWKLSLLSYLLVVVSGFFPFQATENPTSTVKAAGELTVSYNWKVTGDELGSCTAVFGTPGDIINI